MEFDLMDSSFHSKTENGMRSTNAVHLDTFHQLPEVLHQETSSSSDFEFSGTGTATATHFHNSYILTPPPPPSFHETKLIPNFPGNTEITNFNEFPCTSLPLQKRDNSMEAMREMIFRMAMMQPIHIDPESVKPPRRKNVRISKDPQSTAARRRRERISHRIRILQRMVPGGTKLDTASMLEEAVHYVKFLKKQVRALEENAAVGSYYRTTATVFFPVVGPVQML